MLKSELQKFLDIEHQMHCKFWNEVFTIGNHLSLKMVFDGVLSIFMQWYFYVILPDHRV